MRGDFEGAICWVKKAIQACKGSGMQYSEVDIQFLQRLEFASHHPKKLLARIDSLGACFYMESIIAKAVRCSLSLGFSEGHS
ncbi:MAG: hypothetical protein R3B74_05030 [Nitrospirales bacterium]|nr:hypothetical protein [Nitrospirales bacterium]